MSSADPQLAELDDETRAKEVIQTLEIRTIIIKASGGVPRPLINIYLHCPFKLDNSWTHLVNAVSNAVYQHSLLGTGTYHRGWMCTMCHGADHPFGLCPFKRVDNWIHPMPIPPIEEFRRKLAHSENPNTEQHRGGRRGRGGNVRGGRPTRSLGKSNQDDQLN